MNGLKKAFLLFILILFVVVPVTSAISDDSNSGGGGSGDVEKLPLAPNDPDISDVCTLSDCSPAKPCADPDENCYTLNGVFYCCTSAPVPGMEAVGD
ncbi:MAG TPA: hypothetical protein VHC46_01245 [Thermodesulfobacteriota bacterium]|nr:hypothetical protein [Thermodesulfobacteriota bacterium]